MKSKCDFINSLNVESVYLIERVNMSRSMVCINVYLNVNQSIYVVFNMCCTLSLVTAVLKFRGFLNKK